jgi:type IV pilus assembly protein PilB
MTDSAQQETKQLSNDDLLQLYATATKTEIISSIAQIDNIDKPMEAMFEWCKSLNGSILVLKSGSILATNPSERQIQNCKAMMLNKGIYPGQVYAASRTLINLILASDITNENEYQEQNTSEVTFSEQQKSLRELIDAAVKRNASDIHIQVRSTYTLVRMRQNGELQIFVEWTEQLGREIASVAFNKETDHATSHFNPLVPQDASMPLKIGNKDIRLRLASVPAHGGFDMVMRILATGEDHNKTLEELGYTTKQVDIITTAMRLPFGAIIVAGPTGSGKTTTLATCMSMVSDTAKLYSIEDPVEKVVEKATQVPVNIEKADRGFASMGRAALRMDPNVIILGEIRDEDTASVMVRASITGHLVLSTIHTNRATGIITRLLDMKVSPSLLSDSSLLRCLMCQRLAVKVCPKCCIPLRESRTHQPYVPAWEEILGAEIINQARTRGSGCNNCQNSGVSGRVVVAEVIYVDEESRLMIAKGETLEWEKYLKANGWENFYDRAIDLVTQGIIDPIDAEKVVGPINTKLNSNRFMYK